MPDSTIIVDFMLNRLSGIIEKLLVYPENMLKNINLTHGLIYSQGLLLRLARKGISREQAYKMVQKNAMKVWQEGADFRNLVSQDQDIMQILTEDEMKDCFDMNQYLRRIDEIFERVFG